MGGKYKKRGKTKEKEQKNHGNEKITKYFGNILNSKSGIAGSGDGNKANLTQTRAAAGGWVGGLAENAMGDRVGNDMSTEVVSLSKDRVETEDCGGKTGETTRKLRPSC